MEHELEELGAAVRVHRGRDGGLRLPKSLRAEVTEVAQRARDAGMSVQRLAELAGVSTQSIHRWTRPKKRTRLVPVKMAPPPLAPTLTLISPGGWRVSGLDVRSAAALLRATR